jgi:hypothetical protein
MAQDYSSLIATSILYKSVFSIAGLQITKRQNRLALNTIGIIMYLQSWGLLLNEDNDDEVDDIEDIYKD